MSINSTKIGKSLELIPIDLATILDPVEGLQARDINDGGKLKYYDSATSTWLAVGSGGGASDHNDLDNIQGGDLTERYHLTEDEHDTVQNLIAERHSNAILNDDSTPVHTIGNWVRYKNAGAVPTTGTGGTPDEDFVFARDTSNPSPLSSGFSFRINKLNLFNAQGNGVSLTKDVPLALRGNFIKFSFAKAIIGSINSGDFTLHVYDVTNSAMLPAIGPNEVKGANGSDSLLVSIPANCTQVRFIIHCATASTDLKVFVFEDVSMELADPVNIPQAVIGGGTVSKITTDQTGISNSGDTKITFNNIREPAFGGMTWNASRNSWDVNQSGRLLVNAQFFWSTISGMANLSVIVYKNGVRYDTRAGNATTGTYSPTTQGNFSIPVVAGDYIELYAQQNAGSSMSIRAGDQSTMFAVTLLSDQETIQGLAVNANPRRETKFLDSNITTSISNIASLRFDDLKIGHKYKISLYMSTANNGVNNSMGGLEYTNNGVRVLNNQQEISAISGSGYTSQSRVPIVREAYFTAASTSLIANTIGSLSGRVIYGSAGNDTVNTYAILEEVVDPSMLMATPEAKMRVDGYLGVGSTNLTTIRYDQVVVNNPGSFFTYNASAALGSSYTINVKGRYRITQGVGSSNANAALAGITVNSANPSANIHTLSYANGFRAAANSSVAGASNTASWSGVLNPGDIVRTQFDAGSSHLYNGASVYFEIEFLGYVS